MLHIRARILGFIIYDNLKPPKPKKNKAKSDQLKKKKRSAVEENKSTFAQKQVSEGNEKSLTVNSIKSINKEDDSEKAEDNNSEKTNTEYSDTDNINIEYNNSEYSNSDQSISESADSENIKTENIKTENTKTENTKTENTKTGNSKLENSKIDPSDSGKKEFRFSKLYHKLKVIPERWKAAYLKVCDKLQAIRNSIRNKVEKLKDFITDIRHKWKLIYDFWMDELNKQGLKYTWQIIKKLLKHILPTKLKSELIIGTGDPYSTGQLLSVISFFYGFYGDKVSVIPDFENSRFEGKHYARGRIRAATILIIACRLLIDKRFKYLKKNFLILKEAL